MLDSIISLFSSTADLVSSGHNLISGIQQSRNERRLIETLEQNSATFERLSDQIIYAPELSNSGGQGPTTVEDLREVRQQLEPLAELTNGHLLSGGILRAPRRTSEAFTKDSWAILTNVRPYNLSVAPNDPDMIPISFQHKDERFIGWQKRDVIPLLFDWEVDQKSGILLPNTGHQAPSHTPDPPPVPEDNSNLPPEVGQDYVEDFSLGTNRGGWWIGNEMDCRAGIMYGEYRVKTGDKTLYLHPTMDLQPGRNIRISLQIRLYPEGRRKGEFGLLLGNFRQKRGFAGFLPFNYLVGQRFESGTWTKINSGKKVKVKEKAFLFEGRYDGKDFSFWINGKEKLSIPSQMFNVDGFRFIVQPYTTLGIQKVAVTYG